MDAVTMINAAFEASETRFRALLHQLTSIKKAARPMGHSRRMQNLCCQCGVVASLMPGVAIASSTGPVGSYGHWGVNGVMILATVATVLICVLLHYEALNLLSQRLSQMQGSHRRRVLFSILGLLSVHVAEIWVFGIAFTLLLLSPLFGAAHGVNGGLLDFVYVSAMMFSTVGSADAYLTGPVRFLAGTEALTGLVLVTWSASFTFLEMQRFWRER